MESVISKENKEQHRYKSNEIINEMNIDDIEQDYNKWVDESLVINLESPQSIPINKRDTPKIEQEHGSNPQSFTKEFIKNLPEAIIKNIISIRSDCLVNYSRETRILSQNNSYKAKIKELQVEIENLNSKIKEIHIENEKNCKNSVKNAVKPLKIEIDLIREAR